MKKITLSFLFTALITLGFSQDYNYSIEFVGAAGPVETYNLVITATAAIPGPDADAVDNFQTLIGWDDGAFTNPLLSIVGGEFGATGNYLPTLLTAAVVNDVPTPGTGSNDKDVYQLSYPTDPVTSHPSGAILMRQFTVTRTPAGAGAPDPVILDNADSNVTYINSLGPFGLQNSVVVNNGGVFEERYNPAVTPMTLSNDGFDFNALTFTAYPNPTKGTLFVQNPSARDFDYEVVSITGRIVVPNGTLASRSENKIELGGLNDGVYFLNIKSSSDDKKSIKIILN